MKSQTEKQKTTETKKPRFKIEKLEERIAPHHRLDHYRGGPHYRCTGMPRRC
jgi:hypothetical protein